MEHIPEAVVDTAETPAVVEGKGVVAVAVPPAAVVVAPAGLVVLVPDASLCFPFFCFTGLAGLLPWHYQSLSGQPCTPIPHGLSPHNRFENQHAPAASI